ncbi:MAG: tagatose 1,6-diphosphate aldolase [Schleiferilactobacillus perolens]|jgi:tagatose 1,6-diphosphate aldolase|uniref:Tagatose 1,6-diphosphate aldolase n=1 Tax=Schleiferilactobacillus perolens DSM 12744 TaxID=1423792 RepID=A0A0R1MPU8_9LACO|nr:tagatose 1,6-diphosphate aldolase [Schleiferilactobacillus perolens]KRL10030.1 tagatose 1,6-diphosphate aldolase [Schleiferilactobacillus perolens DSM 12744]MCI1891064.1 tagatose 1,6-diphosphate aldolase [Schleiferilactobacillus harbinensis]MCI1912014.1 tagatose 1,6-diphosphate aldolase [Schleiferilactobacillus harbinensis]
MSVKLTAAQLDHLHKLSDDNNVISALAIDQRGSLKKMLAAAANKPADETTIVDFKKAVSAELTKYASAILLDPEYGLPASKVRAPQSGLLLSYEKTGYDVTEAGRFPDLIENQSALRIKEEGGDAVKFLLYYDTDEPDAINDRKKAFVERVGAEAKENGLPLFLELVSYDGNMDSASDAAFAKVKPHKVIEMTKEFSKPRYNVSVLKLEVPVNQKFVEGYTDDGVSPVYSKDEAAKYYKEQSEATSLPFIFLSAGVTNELFLEELKFAKQAGSTFNGVLCGRATWKPGIEPFAAQGEEAGQKWLENQGRDNIERLNKVLADTATPWTNKVEEENTVNA